MIVRKYCTVLCIICVVIFIKGKIKDAKLKNDLQQKAPKRGQAEVRLWARPFWEWGSAMVLARLTHQVSSVCQLYKATLNRMRMGREESQDFPEIFLFRNTNIVANFLYLSRETIEKLICAATRYWSLKITQSAPWVQLGNRPVQWSKIVCWRTAEEKTRMSLSRSNNQLTSFEFIGSEARFLFLVFGAWHRQRRQPPRTRVQQSRVRRALLPGAPRMHLRAYVSPAAITT